MVLATGNFRNAADLESYLAHRKYEKLDLLSSPDSLDPQSQDAARCAILYSM
jgi:hypothetical protein